MGVRKIEHIAIAVKDLQISIPLFEKLLGTPCYLIEKIEEQKVKTAFFKIGDTKIELLEATSSESTVAKFIENKGEGLHHIAFDVENIKETLSDLEEKGFKLIDAQPRKGAEGLSIAFLHPKSTGGTLIELCSSESENNQ